MTPIPTAPAAGPLTTAQSLRFLALAAAAVAAPAWAAGGESPFLEELPLVLTASRLPQPVNEVPGAVTVIDREFIAATGYRDLARLFRLVPGMQVGQERGHAQWVTYHGLSNDFPTEMQVLIDGRSVISASAFGGVDWSALPITVDEIERIEVVRGTNANGFGANAFLGVINIITSHAAERPGAGVELARGSTGVRDAAAHWSGHGGPLALRFEAAARRDEGFDELHDDRRMDVLTVRGDWDLSAQDALTLRAGASAGKRGEGYADSVFGNNAPREARNHDYTVHLQWRHAPTLDSEWLLSYYRNDEDIRDEWSASAPAFGYPAVPLDRDRRSVRDDVELQQHVVASSRTQFVWGAEARRDAVEAPFLFHGGNPPAQRLYRLFANGEWRVRPTVTVNLGAAEEKYSGTSPHLSPRLFANWQATAADTLRAGYARAWRQRNLFELFGDVRAVDPASGDVLVRPYLPNPNLRQTRIDSLEVGYFGRLPRWGGTLDVRLFNERIDDFIVRVPQADPAPDIKLSSYLGSTRYENLDHAITLRGIEYQLSVRPWRGAEWRLAHSLVDRRFEDAALAHRTAPYSASLSWLQDWGAGWKSMVSVLRMGALAGGDGYVPVPDDFVARPYTTVDANVRRTLRVGGRGLTLSLTAVNLGPRHQEIADRSEQLLRGDRPANPATRSVWLGVALALD